MKLYDGDSFNAGAATYAEDLKCVKKKKKDDEEIEEGEKFNPHHGAGGRFSGGGGGSGKKPRPVSPYAKVDSPTANTIKAMPKGGKLHVNGGDVSTYAFPQHAASVAIGQSRPEGRDLQAFGGHSGQKVKVLSRGGGHLTHQQSARTSEMLKKADLGHTIHRKSDTGFEIELD